MSETGPSNRKFAMVFTVFFAIVAFTLRRKHSDLVPYAAALSALFLIAGVFVPGLLTPLNRAWMKLADLLHWITSPIILGVLFYALFTPVALLMKLIKRDALKRGFDPTLATYWNTRSPAGPTPASLGEQF
jgi:hypothetical protein